jgi:AAA15 family ATPase/GTPase
MLTRITVNNFKSFNEDFVFELQNSNGYNFNNNSVSNGIIQNAIVYGKNGVGKSNLGLAIFDIIRHLTDTEHGEIDYDVYLNALNESKYATFCYEFLIDSYKVIYSYKKLADNTILFESFSIGDNLIAYIDRDVSNLALINFNGTESLNREIVNPNLSLLKYLKNNLVLSVKDSHIDTFLLFYEFVEGMLFFKSLSGNMYRGLEFGKTIISDDIIQRGNIKKFELFLNQAGIECKLTVIEESGKNVLAFDFDGKPISFYSIASHGTKALTLYYFWLQKLKDDSKGSFLFIDEFDAFYHHELSKLIVENLKELNIQFILTTHNTSIMTNDLLRPDCYYIMQKSSIKSLSKCTAKELREAHNLEKMYKSGAFYV